MLHVHGIEQGDKINVHSSPLIPTDGPPAATAAKAYSICTSFPEGLWNELHYEFSKPRRRWKCHQYGDNDRQN
jgi:hypothetical protein